MVFSADGLPGGLSIDPATGLISGALDSTASNGSPYFVTVTVDDADTVSTDQVMVSFNWTVNVIPVPIVIDPIADQTNTEADPVSLQVIASGGNGALTYSASDLPPGLSIDPNTGLISGCDR